MSWLTFGRAFAWQLQGLFWTFRGLFVQPLRLEDGGYLHPLDRE